MKDMHALLLTLFLLSLSGPSFSGGSDGNDPHPLGSARGIKWAENSIQTKDGRIFVSAKNGLFNLHHNKKDGWQKIKISSSINKGENQKSCYHLGMTQNKNILYTLCVKNIYNLFFTKKYLMAMDLSSQKMELKIAGELSTAGIPNGLAADNNGDLYYTSSGILYPGNIHRITLQSPFEILKDRKVVQFPYGNPNGIKISGEDLYVSSSPVLGLGISRITRYTIQGDQLDKEKVISRRWGFFDDLILLSGKQLLQVDYLCGCILKISESQGKTSHFMSLHKPTSVLLVDMPDQSGKSALLITLRGDGKAILYPNLSGLLPR